MSTTDLIVYIAFGFSILFAVIDLFLIGYGWYNKSLTLLHGLLIIFIGVGVPLFVSFIAASTFPGLGGLNKTIKAFFIAGAIVLGLIFFYLRMQQKKAEQ